MLEKVKQLLSAKNDRASFFAVVGRYFPQGSADFQLIERAYNTAKDAFRETKREGGERYFEHLRAVALILMVYLRVRDPNVIAAGLLHDIVEDIDGWNEQRLALEFNHEIAMLVWWVSKPPASKFNEDKEARNRAYHQNLRHAPRDSILIKLADRLHNLLTQWASTNEKQQRKVTETQDFYLPIAEGQIILIHEIEAAIGELEASWKTK